METYRSGLEELPPFAGGDNAGFCMNQIKVHAMNVAAHLGSPRSVSRAEPPRGSSLCPSHTACPAVRLVSLCTRSPADAHGHRPGGVPHAHGLCLHSPDFKDGLAVLHSQGQTLSSLARYFVFPQSADRVVPTLASSCKETQRPQRGAPWCLLGGVAFLLGATAAVLGTPPSGKDPKPGDSQSGLPSRGHAETQLPGLSRGFFKRPLGMITHSHQQTGEVAALLQMAEVCVPTTRGSCKPGALSPLVR